MGNPQMLVKPVAPKRVSSVLLRCVRCVCRVAAQHYIFMAYPKKGDNGRGRYLVIESTERNPSTSIHLRPLGRHCAPCRRVLIMAP